MSNALPADTVIVDSAPSTTLAGSAVTDQVGVSSSTTVTVAEPTSPPLWDAVTTTVSSPPSMTPSSTAVTVAVTDMSPASSVNDDDSE